MEIKDLQAGQGKIDVEVVVKSKENVRTFNKYGKDLRVCNAIVSDGSGEIVLSLWNDDIDKINAGDKVKVSNGYVSEFNGKKQLSSGKFGRLEILDGKSSESSAKQVKKAEKIEEEDVAF